MNCLNSLTIDRYGQYYWTDIDDYTHNLKAANELIRQVLGN